MPNTIFENLWTRVFAGLLLLLCFTGCDDSAVQDLRVDTQGNVRVVGNDAVVFQDNVRQLSEGQTYQVADLTENTVTFEGAAPPVAVGDVIIKADGLTQFTRKVASVTQENGRTVVTTGRVGFEDIFKEADIQETIEMGPEFLRSLRPSLPGVTFGEPVQVRAQSNEVAAWELPVHFDDAVIGDSGRGSLAVDGTIGLRIALRTDLKVGLFSGVERFALVPKITVSGKLKATGTGSGEFRKEVPLCPDFSYPLVGFAGIGLNLEGTLLITVDGFIQSGGDLTVSGSVAVEGGVEATNNQWRAVSSFVPTFNVEPPKLLAEATLNLSLLTPKISVNLADMGEVYVNAQMLRLETEARAATVGTQAGYDVRVYRNFFLEAGAHLAVGIQPFLYRYDGYFPVVTGDRQQVAQIGVPLPPLPKSGGINLVSIFGSDTPLKVGEERLLGTFQLLFDGFIPLPVFQALSWQSSNSSAVRVTNLGFAAIIRGVGAGTADITATPSNGVAGRLTQQVSSTGLRSLQLIDEGLIRGRTLTQGMFLGQTSGGMQVPEFRSAQLRAFGVYDDGTVRDLTYAVRWSSDGEKARAFRNGQLDGRLEGATQLTVRDDVTGRSTSMPLQVVREPIRFLNIFPLTPERAQVTTGQTLQLRSNARYADNSVREVTRFIQWTSSDPSVATVRDGLVTPTGAGEVEITVSDPNSSARYSKRVVVNQAPQIRLEVSPSDLASAFSGDSRQFSAIAVYADGQRRDVSSKATWRSSNEGVGTLSPTGFFRFERPGRVKVKALFGGFTGSTTPFDVLGPSLMLFTRQPGDTRAEAPFSVAVEIRDAENKPWTRPLPVTLELFGGSSTANLAGTVTQTTVNGVATFSGLTINQVGEGYRLRAVSSGLPVIESDPFSVLAPPVVTPPTGGGGGGTPPPVTPPFANLFLTNRSSTGPGGLRVLDVAANGTVTQPPTNLYSTQFRPEGMIRLGQYIYTATTGNTASANIIVGHRYNSSTGVLTPFAASNPPSTFGGIFQPVYLTSDGSDGVIYAAGYERYVYSFAVDSTTGELGGNASFQVPGTTSTIGGIVYYDVSGSTQDLVFFGMREENQIWVYGFNSATNVLFGIPGATPGDPQAPLEKYGNPLPAGPGAGQGGSPAALATVGANLFATNPDGDALTQFQIVDANAIDNNPATLILTPVATPIATGDAPVGIFSTGTHLYVGNQVSSDISAYSVSGSTVTALNSGTTYPAGDINPHSFTEVVLSGAQSVLYVATSTNLVAFTFNPANGLLTPLTLSLSGLGSPGIVQR